MKKIAAILLTFTLLLTFASCKNNDTPEGMQLLRGSDDIGYYFYIPEEWTPANIGSIASAYASSVDKTSVSFAQTDMPEGTIEDYFNESLKEFPTPPTLVSENQPVTFGNADSAVMYIYDHMYETISFRTMQIFTVYSGRFGIFTFTAQRSSDSDKESKFDYYKEKRQSIIENFKFVPKTNDKAPQEPVYEKDGDGYNLVSDIKTCKFSLYLPDEFKVNFSSGMVLASLPDGSNVTMSQAQITGVYVKDYFAIRIEELESIVKDIKIIEFTDKDGEKHPMNGDAKFGNATNAVSQEYTFVYNGRTYHVYQVCAIKGSNNCIFTYTATEENFEEHFETIQKICEKAVLK